MEKLNNLLLLKKFLLVIQLEYFGISFGLILNTLIANECHIGIMQLLYYLSPFPHCFIFWISFFYRPLLVAYIIGFIVMLVCLFSPDYYKAPWFILFIVFTLIGHIGINSIVSGGEPNMLDKIINRFF